MPNHRGDEWACEARLGNLILHREFSTRAKAKRGFRDVMEPEIKRWHQEKENA